MSDLLSRISFLAKQDKKDIVQKALKTTEECGELAEAVLSSTGAPTCEYKQLTKVDVLKESVDTATCAISVAVMAGFTPEEIMVTFYEKLDAWERKIAAAAEKKAFDEAALQITQHFSSNGDDV